MTSTHTAASVADSLDGLLSTLGETNEAMIGAVLHGGGLERVAAIAADAVAGPVAVVIPSSGVALAACQPHEQVDLEAVEAWVVERLRGSPSVVPADVVAEAPIRVSQEVVGVVALLRGARAPRPQAGEFLRLAAAAAATELAIEDAREQTEASLRGSLLEELRSRDELCGSEIVRRASRLGCDLAKGAVVLCLELTVGRPRLVLGMIDSEHPQALAEELDASGEAGPRRIYAVLPAVGACATPESVLAAATRLATRLRRYGAVGTSGFNARPADLGRAVREAELMLEVAQHVGEPIAQDVVTSTYRLLFRMLASHPRELHEFYERTVAAIVAYDDQNRTELVRTLDTYLGANCNMNATAARLFAHRHTVAYRLERVRELTGLDPTVSSDREPLGLGLKVHRLLRPHAAPELERAGRGAAPA
jgi:sugar diacid utilization regulator